MFKPCNHYLAEGVLARADGSNAVVAEVDGEVDNTVDSLVDGGDGAGSDLARQWSGTCVSQ